MPTLRPQQAPWRTRGEEEKAPAPAAAHEGSTSSFPTLADALFNSVTMSVSQICDFLLIYLFIHSSTQHSLITVKQQATEGVNK